MKKMDTIFTKKSPPPFQQLGYKYTPLSNYLKGFPNSVKDITNMIRTSKKKGTQNVAN